MIKAGGRTIHSEIHKHINSIRNEEELPEQWKELIIVRVCKMGVKQTSNYTGIPLLSTADKILSNILLSGLTPYAEEITGDHNCGF